MCISIFKYFQHMYRDNNDNHDNFGHSNRDVEFSHGFHLYPANGYKMAAVKKGLLRPSSENKCQDRPLLTFAQLYCMTDHNCSDDR